MRQSLSTGSIILIASVMAMTTTSIFSAPTFSQEVSKKSTLQHKRLQHALNNIYKNPKLAEQELKVLPTATAKAYLAFLYMSQKTTFHQTQRKIDSLIRQGIAQIPDKSALGEYHEKDVHCTTMEDLLGYLSFISNNEKSEPSKVSIRMFEQYPKECMSAFIDSYNYHGQALPFEPTKADEFEFIPAVAALYDNIRKIAGPDDREAHGRELENSIWQERHLASLEAAFAPRLYFEQMNTADGKHEYQDFLKFMENWSTLELYNHKMYLALQRDEAKAVAPLTALYVKRFNLSTDLAHKYAEATLKGYIVGWLARYDHPLDAREFETPIYKAFAPHSDSIDDLKKKIGQREMTKEELAQALRLQILNGGNLEIIDWLLKLGAPVSGGRESPLFTAIERPDVVSALLHAGAKVEETNAIGKSALIQAAQYNALSTIKELTDAGADINHKMTATDDDHKIIGEDPSTTFEITNTDYSRYRVGGRTALMYAAGFADADTIDYLLGKGADKTAKDCQSWKAVKFLGWNKKISKADRARLTKELN